MAASGAIILYCHLDILGRHRSGGPLSCLTGWIAARGGHEVVWLGLSLGSGRFLRCQYPFHRADVDESGVLAGTSAMTGFNAVIAEAEQLAPAGLEFVVALESAAGGTAAYRFALPLVTGTTQAIRLSESDRLAEAPELEETGPAAASAILEERLFDHLARERRLTLRLDLINKCNLRCVMCHYSDEDFARRPLQRIAPEQFASWFEPLAPLTREVVLSCGDEPLMSPHFETILGQIAARDPEVQIQFCTNAMLLNERIARAIVAARVGRIMLSFDGVTPATLHRIRVNSDFGRIVKNILGLKRERARGGAGPRFIFNFVMLESNIHEAPLFVTVAKRLGGDAIDFRHVVKYGLYDIEDEMLENYKPKYNHYRERIAQAAAAEGIKIFIPPPFASAGRHDPSADPACSLAEFEAVEREFGAQEAAASAAPPYDAAEDSPDRIVESAHFFCDRPFSEVMIREQRDVYPCPWHREKMGVLDSSTSLSEIFFGENFRRVRLAMLDPHGAPGCAGCPIKANQLPTRTLQPS